jgi:hypothetical protein
MEFYLVKFGSRMWEILIFNLISATENSNKFQTTRFRKKKSVEAMVTLGPTAEATLVKTLMNIYINTDVNTRVHIYTVYTNIHTYMYLT